VSRAADGWRAITLGDVLTRQIEAVPVTDDAMYPLAGVYSFGRGVLLREAVQGSQIAAKQLYRIRLGQIIFSKLTAFEGAFALVGPEADGRFVSNEFPTFSVDTDEALPEYIDLVLRRPACWEELVYTIPGGGSRRERFQPEDLLEFPIDLPPLADQMRIVAATSVVETAVLAHMREASAANQALRALREDLLETSDEWDFLPDGWQLKMLGELSDIRSGITKGRKASGLLTAVPFMRAANVQNGVIDLAEVKTIEATASEIARFSLAVGDILMVEGSGSPERLGQGWVWDGQVEPCLHQNHVFRARPDQQQVRPRFLAYALQASPARQYCLDAAKTTSGLATINKAQISGIPVPVPPLAAQDVIVSRLDAVNNAGAAAMAEVKLLRQVRASLLEELVTGARSAPSLALA
jgi:type I restriction enzyme S subunit